MHGSGKGFRRKLIKMYIKEGVVSALFLLGIRCRQLSITGAHGSEKSFIHTALRNGVEGCRNRLLELLFVLLDLLIYPIEKLKWIVLL